MEGLIHFDKIVKVMVGLVNVFDKFDYVLKGFMRFGQV